MRKLSYGLSVFLSTLVSIQGFCQLETFDIATYTPPKNWKKDAGQGVITYSSVDEKAGKFCVLAIYASKTSLGDAQKDFKNEWKELVVTPYSGEANPKTETRVTTDGWTVVAAASLIKLENVDAYAILTVFSGFGKKFSLLAQLNDQLYSAAIDGVLENIKLDKTVKPVIAQTNIQPVNNTNQTKGQFGTVIYAAPAGWSMKNYSDGDILIPANLPKNEFLEIWVMTSMKFSGTLEQALQKSYDETVAKLNAQKMRDINGGDYDMREAKRSFRGWEYIRCNGGIRMGGGDYPPEYGLDLFVIKLNDRFERIAIVKSRNNCGLSRYYPTDRLTYFDDVENFLFSLQFPDWKEPVIKMAGTKGDGITGVWQGIALSVGMVKPGASLGAELKVKQAIFFSNGQAFFGTRFPTEGFEGLNTWILSELNRRDWGTYSFANGKGVLKLPYADIPLRMENNKLIIRPNNTDHGFIKMPSVDGARFDGSYALSEYNGKIPVITFTAAGKFKDNGAMHALYHEYIDCLNAAITTGSGDYEVKNHTIIFNYEDGRKIKIAFTGFDYNNKNNSPATLTLSSNADVLHKQ
jgi:hypothetical protein